MKATENQEILRRTVRGSLASIHVGCLVCGRSYVVPIGGAAARDDSRTHEILCTECGCRTALELKDLDPARPVESCAVCGNREFYVQKDFNRKVGLWLVIISGLVALLVMLLTNHLVGILVLVLITVADWWVFRRLKDVAVCYLCSTIYRGFPRNPDHGPFYLGSEERFKKLRQKRIEELRV